MMRGRALELGRRVFLVLCGLGCVLFAPPLRADATPEPILRAKLNETVAVPGQILVLDVTILVPTWMPEPPEFPTFELTDVSIQLPEGASRPTTETVEGETWSGVTRAYQISPMAVGRFRIPPQTIRITYAEVETRAPLTRELETDELVFEGRAPAGAEGLDPFIAAEDLTLEQDIEGDPQGLTPGAAFTRVVTARITGASAIFLPPLIPPLEARGLAAYPREPVFETSSSRGREIGRRTERVTYVAEAGGRHATAPIRLRWWNLRTKEIEVSEIEPLEIVSTGPAPRASIMDEEGRLPWLAAIIALFSILSGVAWFLAPRIRLAAERRRARHLASEAFAFGQIRSALKSRRLGDAMRAAEVWAHRLPDLSDADRKRIFEPLEPIAALLYGQDGSAPGPEQWSEALTGLRATRRALLESQKQRRNASELPALNPR